jgi:hypothetical protein
LIGWEATKASTEDKGIMNIADLANERVFAEVKRFCLMGREATTLRQRVTERLRRAVPFEGYVAFTMDPSSGLITHVIVEQIRLSTPERLREADLTTFTSTAAVRIIMDDPVSRARAKRQGTRCPTR